MKKDSTTKNKLLSPQLDTPEGFIRLSGPTEHDNIVNGPGLRAIIWAQGCRQRCPGCQNPETWAEDGGSLVSLDEIKKQLSTMKGQAGLTFCGGEPFLQSGPCLEIARWVKKELGWSVWSFTGLIYEQIPKEGVEWKLIQELDALIDGPFILPKRDISLKWRGSANQRILHLEDGEIMSIE